MRGSRLTLRVVLLEHQQVGMELMKRAVLLS